MFSMDEKKEVISTVTLDDVVRNDATKSRRPGKNFAVSLTVPVVILAEILLTSFVLVGVDANFVKKIPRHVCCGPARVP